MQTYIEMKNIEDEETIQFPKDVVRVGCGSVGLRSQVPGIATTVSAVAEATGGLHGGSLFVKSRTEK